MDRISFTGRHASSPDLAGDRAQVKGMKLWKALKEFIKLNNTTAKLESNNNLSIPSTKERVSFLKELT